MRRPFAAGVLLLILLFSLTQNAIAETATHTLRIEAFVQGKKAKGIRCRIESPELSATFATPKKLRFKVAKGSAPEFQSMSCIYRGTIRRITSVPDASTKRIQFNFATSAENVKFLNR